MKRQLVKLAAVSHLAHRHVQMLLMRNVGSGRQTLSYTVHRSQSDVEVEKRRIEKLIAAGSVPGGINRRQMGWQESRLSAAV